jgi:hypothetical protein
MTVSREGLRRALLRPYAPRWWEKSTWRWECAIALWVWAICILVSNSDLSPIGWQDWLVVAWAFVKVGLLALAGLLLGIANEDLKSLEQSNETLREIIGKLQDGR